MRFYSFFGLSIEAQNASCLDQSDLFSKFHHIDHPRLLTGFFLKDFGTLFPGGLVILTIDQRQPFFGGFDDKIPILWMDLCLNGECAKDPW